MNWITRKLVHPARHARWALICALATASLAGCAGETQVRAGLLFDYPVTYVHRPPHRVHRYPRVYYHGRPAYLVRGRWYYSSPRGWALFREEPRELRAYRERRQGWTDRGPRRRYYDDRERRRHDDGERRRYRSRDGEPDGPIERRRWRSPR